MKTASFAARLRAARTLSIAMEDGNKPDAKSLKILGLPEDFKVRFKR